jgi:hypothetical protein
MYRSVIRPSVRFIDPAAELACAVTILFPSLVSITYILCGATVSFDAYNWAVLSACLVHAPFSFALHIARFYGNNCYFGRALVFRKLDYTFIHVSSVLLSVGLSKSPAYGILALGTNARFVFDVWTSKRICTPRIEAVSLCVAIYVFGLALRQRYMDCIMCAALFTIALSYVCTGGAYEYACMHVICGIVQFVILNGVC